MAVLHGILGSRPNWRTIAKKLVAARPGWGLVLVDLRRHGDSLDVDGDDTVPQAATDVLETFDALDLPLKAVLGHSFGGKVALSLTEQRGEGLEHVFVIDAMPGPWQANNTSGTPEVVAALHGFVDGRFSSRNEFIEGFMAKGFSKPLAMWLAMNLRRTDDGVEFPLDMAAIDRLLADYFVRDYWSVVEAPPAGCTVHLVIGGKSTAFDAEAEARARSAEGSGGAGGVRVHLLAEAGHWVHADDPEGLLGVLVGALG